MLKSNSRIKIVKLLFLFIFKIMSNTSIKDTKYFSQQIIEQMYQHIYQ